MNAESNPYSSPIEVAESVNSPLLENKVGVDFRPILYWWERYRLIYNGVLVAIVLLASLLIAPLNLVRSDYWIGLILGAGVSNFCFLLGPLIEAYGRVFGLWRNGFSRLLFAAGLLLTLMLGLGFVVIYQPF